MLSAQSTSLVKKKKKKDTFQYKSARKEAWTTHLHNNDKGWG